MDETVLNNTQRVLYSWLETTVQGIASRLGYQADFADAFQALSLPPQTSSCTKPEEPSQLSMKHEDVNR